MTDKTDFTSNSSRSLVAIPRTKQELLAKRLNQRAADLNAVVETFYIDKAEDADLILYLEALDNDEAVTGKLHFDLFKAAERLQILAHPALDQYKPTQLMKSLRVVLKRYGLTAEQRVEAMEADAQRRSTER